MNVYNPYFGRALALQGHLAVCILLLKEATDGPFS